MCFLRYSSQLRLVCKGDSSDVSPGLKLHVLIFLSEVVKGMAGCVGEYDSIVLPKAGWAI